MKEKLKEVLSIQTTSGKQFRMFAYIIRQVAKNPAINYYVDNGNIYITKGNAHTFPCVVAHIDSVHNIVSDLSMLECGDNITGFNRHTMTQSGIGGDDKVGIFIALQCLAKYNHIKVAFFRDEEIGCVGSNLADVSFFDDCRFVLQCDRRGNSDFVHDASGVELSSKAFRKSIKHILKQHNYKFSNGMMTDVMALKQLGIDCSMANISCGYYNPHQDNEYVNYPDVMNCMSLVMSIIDQCTDLYPHKYTPRFSALVAPSYKYPKARYSSWHGGSYGSDKYFLDKTDYDTMGFSSKSQKSLADSDTNCKDCWAVPVFARGLCKPCYDGYVKNYFYDDNLW